eukprot:2730747-Prymnesium_polylepis.2
MPASVKDSIIDAVKAKSFFGNGATQPSYVAAPHKSRPRPASPGPSSRPQPPMPHWSVRA